MKFEQWLERQINRDNVVGDLAKDVKDDSRPKPSNNTLDAWQTFLFTAGASREAQQALDEAWAEYSK